ncbi:MAG: outer membrane protein, partial [Acidobacteriota bacterium]
MGAVVTGLVSAAHAQSQTPGWYVGPEAGWSHLQDLKGTADTNYEEYTGSHPITIHPSEGFAAGVTVGYSGVYLPNLRAEGEIVYRSHGLSSASTPAVMILEAAPLFISGPLTGSIDSLALMGNVYYDFMPESRWTPYLGAGIGAARLTVGDAASTTPLPPGRFNATDWQFAYQGIAGVKY